ncbi:MFS transporter [Microbispora sp. H11081]|uniref:MFS transporter n=1 Tax=Microbispora sp. H11081 TaxID=2729107 RepID=UPI00147399EF|nr:MFS transporter [Microbispora sp. H11081]
MIGRLGVFAAAALVPRTSHGRWLAGSGAVDAFGTGLFVTGSALYFTQVVGLTPGQVGLGLTLAALSGFLAAVPIGMVADRLRAGRVYLALQVWRSAGYVAYGLAGDFPTFVVVACLIGLADTAVPPVWQAMTAAAVPAEHRVDTLAKARAVRNIGFGLGALSAAVVIHIGTRQAFMALVFANAVTYAVEAVLLRRAGFGRLETAGPAGQTRRDLGGDARYVASALLNGVLTYHMPLLSLGLPLWIVTATTVPPAMIGVLVAVNTALAVLLQARLARSAVTLPGAAGSMVKAGLSLAAFGVTAFLLAYVGAPWVAAAVAVAAVILLTGGELWQSAGAWTISYELAPPERRARYLATYQLGAALQGILAPLVITGVVLRLSGGWLLFAAVAAVAGLLHRPLAHARRAAARPPEPASPEPAT